MTKKDPKDVLKDVISSIEGIPSDEVKFKDARHRTRKKIVANKIDESEKEHGIISNQEGMKIISSGVDFCDYGEIGKKKRKFVSEKNSLEEWGPRDFYVFANHLYVKKYNKPWDLQIGGSTIQINKIRDKLYEIFGFCCNLIMRDYIVFFFENCLDSIINSGKCFYFTQMGKQEPLLSFVGQYNFKERFSSYMLKEKKSKQSPALSNSEIEKSFAIGDTTLVCNYGIVISLNWLFSVKKMTKEKSAKIVLNACREMHKKDQIGIIVKSTEFYSPYPNDFAFKSPQAIMDKIDSNIHLNVTFEKNDRMRFLLKLKESNGKES